MADDEQQNTDQQDQQQYDDQQQGWGQGDNNDGDQQQQQDDNQQQYDYNDQQPQQDQQQDPPPDNNGDHSQQPRDSASYEAPSPYAPGAASASSNTAPRSNPYAGMVSATANYENTANQQLSGEITLKSGGTIADGERRFIMERLQKSVNDQLVWMDWVRKKHKRKNKVQDRLLVVTRYRIFTIKRGLTGSKSVQREGHILDLLEITGNEAQHCKFSFRDFHIEALSEYIDSAVTAVRVALMRITQGFPERSLPKIDVQPSSRLTSLPKMEPGPANGYIDTYLAQCNYYNTPPSYEIARFVEDTVARNATEFDLGECSGVEVKTSYSFEMMPITAALRHNTYFRAFVLRNVPRKETVVRVADILLHNYTLQRISLVGIDAEQGFVELGEALRQNTSNVLVDLNLSRNRIGDKGLAGLSAGLAGLQHSMNRLVLRDTLCTDRGLAALFEALDSNPRLSQTLVELDISGNKIEATATGVLAMWLQNLGAKSTFNLRRLAVADTNCDVFGLMQAARIGVLKTLIELDVSGDKIDKAAAAALAVALKEPDSKLSRLNCSNCRLSGENLDLILGALSSNRALAEVKLDFSFNELGGVGAAVLAKMLPQCNNLHTLRLRGNNFKPEHVTKITDAVILNNSIRRIDLGQNIRPGKQVLPFAQALAMLVTRHPSLTALDVAGDGKQFLMGVDILPLIESLANNNKLRELNISHNKIGDRCAIALSEALRKNACLQRLKWDNNDITLGGWQAFRAMLQAGNNALCEMGYPALDIERVLAGSARDTRLREKISDVMHHIGDLMRQNALHCTNPLERDGDEDYSSYAAAQGNAVTAQGLSVAPSSFASSGAAPAPPTPFIANSLRGSAPNTQLNNRMPGLERTYGGGGGGGGGYSGAGYGGQTSGQTSAPVAVANDYSSSSVNSDAPSSASSSAASGGGYQGSPGSSMRGSAAYGMHQPAPPPTLQLVAPPSLAAPPTLVTPPSLFGSVRASAAQGGPGRVPSGGAASSPPTRPSPSPVPQRTASPLTATKGAPGERASERAPPPPTRQPPSPRQENSGNTAGGSNGDDQQQQQQQQPPVRESPIARGIALPGMVAAFPKLKSSGNLRPSSPGGGANGNSGGGGGNAADIPAAYQDRSLPPPPPPRSS